MVWLAVVTVTLADAVPPVPPSTDMTEPVVLFWTPGVIPVPVPAKLQDVFAARPRDEMLPVPLPATAVTDPAVTPPAVVKQAPVTPFGVATFRPAGKVSLKPIPVSATVGFEFINVK